MFENYYGSGNPNSWGTADTEHKGFVVRVTYSINGNQSVKDIYLPQVKRNKYCVVLNRIGPDDVITVDYMVADWDDADAWNDLILNILHIAIRYCRLTAINRILLPWFATQAMRVRPQRKMELFLFCLR